MATRSSKRVKKQNVTQAQLGNRLLEVLRYDMLIAIGITLLLFMAGVGVGK